jgi:hypothetical protein
MSVPTTALPADLLPVTHLYGIVAKFYRGDPGSGSVTFRTDGAVIAGDPAVLIYGYSQTVGIDAATGRFEVDWVPGNDPDGAPSTVTVSFDLDNGIDIAPLTFIVPTPTPKYPQKVVGGVPQVDSAGQPVPDTSQTPTYPPVNVFEQPVMPEQPATVGTVDYVTTETNLFVRSAAVGAPGGVATLDGSAMVPVSQIISPATFPSGAALTYDAASGSIKPVAVDSRWRGAITAPPTDQGTQGDYFTNANLTDGSPFMWGCVRSGTFVEDGSPDEALWVAFGGGSGGSGGGVVAVQGTAPIQSSGGAQPYISILPATAVAPGSMSAAHFAKLNGIDANATAYSDENAQDAAARMILGGSHVGIQFTYDDNSATLSGVVTGGGGGGGTTAVSVTPPILLSGTAAAPVIGIQASTTTQDGYMSSAQASKLAGIATSATANATDAQLRARSSHTGTQVASTISDLEAVVRGYPALIRTVTAAATLTLTDEVVRVNASSATAITIPTNAVTAIPVGQFITVSQVGTGVVTIGGSGVTINGLVKSAGQNTDLSLLKVGTDTWDVRGGVS